MRERGGYRIINTDYCMTLTRERWESLAELAEHVHVSRQFMSLLVQGRKTCRASVAQSVARALNAPASVLFVDAEGRPAELPTKRERRRTA